MTAVVLQYFATAQDMEAGAKVMEAMDASRHRAPAHRWMRLSSSSASKGRRARLGNLTRLHGRRTRLRVSVRLSYAHGRRQARQAVGAAESFVHVALGNE